MGGRYELIDHTGDVGIRVTAATLPELFETAAGGMYDILVDAPDVATTVEETIELEGETDELLRAWLGELLYRFSVNELIFRRFEIGIDGRRLRARVRGAPMDRERHGLRTELKAVTYHGLSVRRDGDAWIGEVIFDI